MNKKTNLNDIAELKKNLAAKEKINNDHERKINTIDTLMYKAHTYELSKASKGKKTKPKNTNRGGFCSKEQIPDILVKFLELKDDETFLARTQITKKLNKKFNDLGLQKGQFTTLNKDVVKELELDKSNIDRVIKITEFQTFLKEFYPTKEAKNTVSVC